MDYSINSNSLAGYEPVIELFTTDLQYEIVRNEEEEILKVIHSIGVNVDKEELVKALNYDRDQYRKGFNKGYLAGRAKEQGDWVRIEPYDLNTLQCSRCGYITHERTNYCSKCGSQNMETLS